MVCDVVMDMTLTESIQLENFDATLNVEMQVKFL